MERVSSGNAGKIATQRNLDVMFLPVADQRQMHGSVSDTGVDSFHAGRPFNAGHLDIVPGLPVRKAIAQRVPRPRRRYAGTQHESLAIDQRHAQHRFECHTKHPSRRTGVPRPAAATDVGGHAVHVCGDNVRFHLDTWRPDPAYRRAAPDSPGRADTPPGRRGPPRPARAPPRVPRAYTGRRSRGFRAGTP